MIDRVDLQSGRRVSGANVRPAHGSRWLSRALVAALAVVFAVARPQPALAEPTEQEVKAALIFNITRFVEWPVKAFDSPGAPLVIAIMGRDGVSDVLGPMLQGKSVNGRPLEVRLVRTVEEAGKCHVLYVAGSEKRRIVAILKSMGKTSTLTVADIEHFAERGGHINLVLEDQRVHVMVNLASVTGCRLSISAKLLSLAQIVGAAS
jgi:hypothetical protein